ncbi:hypothetical protein [Ancylobacter mangrovi]|uniref:hypothetical protein n=1 Tax=Ancylobacter mangrovi TaxID=2972472 RepID=UPI00216114EA|nr:hypothetical protein [Ancylobacter mangrovi]MCS0503139.1 hypothetical protein [Ancylobacter mangrovi]
MDDRLEAELAIVARAFDPAFYLSTYPDVAASRMDPLLHFVRFGWKEGRNPNAVFDTAYYLQRYPDIAGSADNPFAHYVEHGRGEGRFASPGEEAAQSAAAATTAPGPGYAGLLTDREADDLAAIADAFDPVYYGAMYREVVGTVLDPLVHFVTLGWKEYRKPNSSFDTRYYLEANPDIAEAGANPFVHYVRHGRAEGRAGSAKEQVLLDEAAAIRPEFDIPYYLAANPDVRDAGVDPVLHYILHGWKEERNPTPDFNSAAYLMLNEDVERSGMNPFLHYIRGGRREKRPNADIDTPQNALLGSRIIRQLQDATFPAHIENAKALCVFLVPEHTGMGGGVLSLFTIAGAVGRLRRNHGYEVVLMTRPNRSDLTITRHDKFRNSEDVFRFSQLLRCQSVERLYIHMPEYMVSGFMTQVTDELRDYLASRQHLFINITNQNIQMMPRREELEDLRVLADELTQSVAHPASFTQQTADFYNLPTLLLPAYVDLSGYEPIDVSDKEKLIIYSPDPAPYREAVLAALKEALPDYRFVEIFKITFDTFMDLASRCMFSISFGEGFDGYIAQPICQGGIGFAVYNETFFHSETLKDLPVIFADPEDMIANIVARIRDFEADEEMYRQVNQDLKALHDSLYKRADYIKRVGQLMRREFDLLPQAEPAEEP